MYVSRDGRRAATEPGPGDSASVACAFDADRAFDASVAASSTACSSRAERAG